MKVFVEPEHKKFILRVHRFRKRHTGGNHQLAVRGHAPAAIDQQTDCYRSILAIEKADGLRLFVLGDAKRVLSEAADISAFLIPDSHVQYDKLGLG